MVGNQAGIDKQLFIQNHEVHVVVSDELAIICSGLIAQYARELGHDLGFQHLDSELQNPLKKYSSPAGLLLLATTGGKPSGCVAYQKLSNDVCEMKRLYVSPPFRQLGIALLLVNQLCKYAKQDHYKTMVLDTLDSLTLATKLYAKLGFSITEPYYYNPLPGVIFLQKTL